MKILILAPDLQELPQVSRYSNNLKSCLQEFAEEGENTDLLTFGDRFGDGKYSFNRFQLEDYQKAAEIINTRYDACILQHHPEAYGGRNGDYILTLAARIQVPLLSIFHAVSNEPKSREKAIISYLAKRSDKVMVFSHLAIEFLEHYYKVNRDIIHLTDYGVSVFDPISTDRLKQLLGVEYQKYIMACGPMCSTSGFETLINATAAIQKKYEGTGLIIIDTSPDNRVNSEYRKTLKRLAVQRGVVNCLKFIDFKHVEGDLEYVLNAADVFVAGELRERVLEDAFLSTAVSSGAAVVSSPTWFAKELLEDKKGSFFAFRSISELTTELTNMLRNQRETKMYRENAFLYGAQNSWIVGVKKIKELMAGIPLQEKKNNLVSAFPPVVLPDVNLNQLMELYHNSGFVCDSKYGIPDYTSGYKLLSNAMALHVLMKANGLIHEDENIELIRKCLGFIRLFRMANGKWASSLNYRLEPQEEVCEYDLGYAIWTLGAVYSTIDDAGIKDVAYEMILQLLKEVQFINTKAKAAALIGIAEVLKTEQSNQELIELMKKWTYQISDLFPSDTMQNWHWHEDEVSEHVGLTLLALLNAYELLHNDELLSIAKRGLRFVERYIFTDSRYSPKIIGRQKGRDDSGVANTSYAGEAYYMTEVYAKMFEITRSERYLALANSVHNWYLGDNSIGKSLYDIASGGCYYSYSGRSVNPLITTSSTCAYWLSHFTIHDVYFEMILSE
ncbi:glycosyltransferase [Carboxylicivirga sp. RSCT41]|uniref:glycosyltransferase n=1 Tax=Carboxylicivirga agarovorans TaxID=3417570 RepID=UPI003D330AEE